MVRVVTASPKFVMLFAQCHALFAVLVLLSAAVAIDGQDYRYRTNGNNNYPPSPPPQSSYDRNLPQSSNPYNPQLNQYGGQQINYPNRPYYQPGRPGTPSFRPYGYPDYNYPVSVYNIVLRPFERRIKSIYPSLLLATPARFFITMHVELFF